jgi:two-component system nitrate/nitrite sensor histidine kinase NarX
VASVDARSEDVANGRELVHARRLHVLAPEAAEAIPRNGRDRREAATFASGGDHDGLHAVVGIGLSGLPAQGTGAIASWCAACAESRNEASACRINGMCGTEARFSAAISGAACRHIAGIPLRCQGRLIGAVNLHFAAADAFAVESMSRLTAAGDLFAAALETARSAREQLATGLVNERQMMANEVHDSLAQGLTYMRMRMSLLRDAIRQGDELRAFKYWGDVDSSLTNAHRRLRELITYFRTRMDPRGLVHALGEMSESFLDRTGIALEFANRAPDLHLPVGREVQVFHIVQEALANVCKHANARQARLVLERMDGGYEIVVEDDGVGMVDDPAAGERGEAGHYGIAIMRERARRLGGELTLQSTPGAGTRVRLYFPAVQTQTDEGL